MSTWEELRRECLNCRKCGLCRTRTNVVFGVGKEDAEVMFIGEGPGQQEDLKGEPFVGRSGQLLDKLMATVDLFRDRNIYIANTVKCRPPQNRDPLPEEQEACAAWLDSQIALMRPKIIVCVGRISAQRYISKDTLYGYLPSRGSAPQPQSKARGVRGFYRPARQDKRNLRPYILSY